MMEFRTLDGTGNDLLASGANAVGDAYARFAPARFADGAGEMAGGPNPNAVHFTIWMAVAKSMRMVACGARGRGG